MGIVQKGNEHTNSSARDGNVPFVIVNHISGGTMGSMDNWFRSAGNKVSSAHFGVSKSGVIHQYVDIRRMAWANGITAASTREAPAAVVRENAPTNPNKYTISIEHEGTDGNLTEEQFAASVWLHKHIANEVKRIYNREMKLDRKHVIGHFQIDPIRKPNCPGPKFPWERLYKALSGEELDVKVDKANTVVNGRKLTEESLLIEGRTYVPLAAIGRAIGATVSWDNVTKTASLNTKEGK